MLSKFKDLDVKMIIKVHYFFNHLECFPTNLGDLSEEHGERFHQDIKVIEERYQGSVGVSNVTAWAYHIPGSLTKENL